MMCQTYCEAASLSRTSHRALAKTAWRRGIAYVVEVVATLLVMTGCRVPQQQQVKDLVPRVIDGLRVCGAILTDRGDHPRLNASWRSDSVDEILVFGDHAEQIDDLIISLLGSGSISWQRKGGRKRERRSAGREIMFRTTQNRGVYCQHTPEGSMLLFLKDCDAFLKSMPFTADGEGYVYY